VRHYTGPIAASFILACLPLGASATSAPKAAPSAVPALRSTCGSAVKQAGAVRVVVSDQTGVAVAGATVTAIEPYRGVLLSSKMTATDGSVVFPGMSETSSLFVVAINGFHTATVQAHLSAGCEGLLEIHLDLAEIVCPITVDGPLASPEPAMVPTLPK